MKPSAAGLSGAAVTARWGLIGLRAAYGAVLLCLPAAAIGLCTGAQSGPRERGTARVLGARQLAQAAAAACDPGRPMMTAGAAIDTVHAASTVLLYRAARPARRAVLADGAVAVFFALAGWTLSWAESSG